jgi:hypothetical protein
VGRFFKEIGQALGGGIGAVTKAATTLVGDVTGIDHIKKIGNAAARVTEQSGAILGNVADGVVEIGAGIINKDKRQGFGGAEKVIDTAAETVNGMAKGVVHTAKTAETVVSGLYEKNEKKVVGGLKTLGTIAAVSVLSVGVFEALDVIDVVDFDDIDDNGADEFVRPHWVEPYTRSDGTHVSGYFRDGDGNTGINLSLEEGGGYFRS